MRDDSVVTPESKIASEYKIFLKNINFFFHVLIICRLALWGYSPNKKSS